MAKTEIDVYITHIDSSYRVLLCSVPSFRDLDPLRDHIRANGIYCGVSGELELDAKLQYVFDGDSAFAEIIIGAED